MRTIPASKFKQQCLALMNEVNQTGVEILITKHGKPVSVLSPPPAQPEEAAECPLLGLHAGEWEINGDEDTVFSTPVAEWESADAG